MPHGLISTLDGTINYIFCLSFVETLVNNVAEVRCNETIRILMVFVKV